MRSLSLLPALSFALAACTPSSEPKAPSPASPPTPVAPSSSSVTAAPTTTPSVEPTAPTAPATAAATEGYASRLLGAAKQNGNVVLGTSVVRDALLLATLGARGVTESELRAALEAKGPLERTVKEATFGDAKVLQATRAWVSTSASILPAYEKQATTFGASVATLDFAKDEAARTTINQWVSAQTQDKVATLIPKGSITRQTQMVLTSALYMRALWATPFTVASTKPEPFQGLSAPVPMMRRTGSMLTAALDESVLVELPYQGSTLVFDAVLPNTKGVMPALDALVAAAKPTQTYLGLPRIDVKSSMELSAPLRALGVQVALSDGADFSGMSEKTKLKIGAVHTSTMLKVDEAGTEAAAAAAVQMMTTSLVRTERTVTFDRPFYAFIRDTRSGAVLFAAWIEKPNG